VPRARAASNRGIHDRTRVASMSASCFGLLSQLPILSRRLLTFPRRALGRTLTVLQSGRLLVGPAQRKPGDRQRRGTWRRLNGDGRTSAPEGSVERPPCRRPSRWRRHRLGDHCELDRSSHHPVDARCRAYGPVINARRTRFPRGGRRACPRKNRVSDVVGSVVA